MKGFTLIEAIIYIALLALIMGGALLAVYQILEGGGALSGKAVVQGEGNFLLRKFDWALTGASSISVDSSVSCAHTAHIVRYDGVTVDLRRNTTNNSVEISEAGLGFFAPITTSNVTVSCLQFQTIPAVGTGPSGVSATTTINGLAFTTTKYLRK